MKYVAMAAEGGFEVESEKTRLTKKTGDQDGDDADQRAETTRFEPGVSSTPAQNGNQRQTTLNRPGDFPDTPGLSTTDFAESVIDEVFPFAKKMDIKYRMHNDKIEVGNISSQAKKSFFPLFTEIRGWKGEYHINPQIKGSLLKTLGKPQKEILEEQIERLTSGINDNKEMAEDSGSSETERNKARERAKMQIEKRTDLKRQLQNLIKKYYNPSHSSESFKLDDFQKNDEERQKREQGIQSEVQKLDAIIHDKNSSPAEIENAKQRKNEFLQEQNDIENERNRENEQLPLIDRLREKVKAIFKKYGFTVGSVLLAVGTTLGVVLSSLSNGLKAVSKGVGNGLKTLGKKIAQILPGLIGAVVSFVFRTAGNVVGFIGKHAWLLILAVAAFLFERVMKRRG